MWKVQRTQALSNRLRKLEKKNQREVAAALDNLDTYLVSLNQGVKPMQLVKHSFVHNEQMGVHAIDQSPLKKGFRALRLYVYADPDTSTIYVITFGDKGQQSDDVKDCCDFVKQLEAEKTRKSQEDDSEASD